MNPRNLKLAIVHRPFPALLLLALGAVLVQPASAALGGGGVFVPGGGSGTNIINYFTPASVTASATNLAYGAAPTVSVAGTNVQTWVFGIPSGAPGANVTNGLNGINGTNGATGATGATGPAGPAGANGTNGVALILTHTFSSINVASNGWTHSYGSKPVVISAMLNCVTSDGGMTAGQSVNLMNVMDASYSQPYFYIGANSTLLIMGCVSTDPSVARITWNGTRNTVSSWSNFTITVIYQ